MSNVQDFPNSRALYTPSDYRSAQRIGRPLKQDIELSGHLGYLQNQFYRNSIYPDRAAAGLASLCTFASIVGHKYFSPTQLKLNLYTGFVLPSGWGKDRIKNGVDDVLQILGLQHRLRSSGASKTAIMADMHQQEIAELIQAREWKGDEREEKAIEAIQEGRGIPITSVNVVDEFHSLLQADERSPWKKDRRDLLLEMYSSTKFIRPTLSNNSNHPPITQSHYNIIGFSTPAELVGALGNTSASGGLVGRFIFLTMNKRPAKDYDHMRELPFNVKHSFEFYKVLLQTNKLLVPWSVEGEKAWIELDRDIIEPMKDDDENGLIANRLSEHVIKLATLLAINENCLKPQVKPAHIKQAWFIRYPLHHNFLLTVQEEGGLGASEFNTALTKTEQAIYNYCSKRQRAMPVSRLKENCAAFRKLRHRDQLEVIASLTNDGKVLASEPPGMILQWIETPADD